MKIADGEDFMPPTGDDFQYHAFPARRKNGSGHALPQHDESRYAATTALE